MAHKHERYQENGQSLKSWADFKQSIEHFQEGVTVLNQFANPKKSS